MSVTLEQRVTALEQQVETLRRIHADGGTTAKDWVDDLYGKFAGDPVFNRAMKLGRDYRRAQRPSATRKPKAKK